MPPMKSMPEPTALFRDTAVVVNSACRQVSVLAEKAPVDVDYWAAFEDIPVEPELDVPLASGSGSGAGTALQLASKTPSDSSPYRREIYQQLHNVFELNSFSAESTRRNNCDLGGEGCLCFDAHRRRQEPLLPTTCCLYHR